METADQLLKRCENSADQRGHHLLVIKIPLGESIDNKRKFYSKHSGGTVK